MKLITSGSKYPITDLSWSTPLVCNCNRAIAIAIAGKWLLAHSALCYNEKDICWNFCLKVVCKALQRQILKQTGLISAWLLGTLILMSCCAMRMLYTHSLNHLNFIHLPVLGKAQTVTEHFTLPCNTKSPILQIKLRDWTFFQVVHFSNISPIKLHHFIYKHFHNLFYVMQPLFHYWWDCYYYYISCIYISSNMPNVLHLFSASQIWIVCNITIFLCYFLLNKVCLFTKSFHLART